MFDYDRLATLFVCLGLLGLFVIVFNVETVLPALRRLTCYLTPSESTAAHAIRHPPSKKNSARLIPRLFFLLDPRG